MKRFVKDKDAVNDYRVVWSDYLGTDTIASSTFTTTDPSITIESQDNDSTSATVVVSGGIVGMEHLVVNHIVTNGGSEDDEELYFLIVEK